MPETFEPLDEPFATADAQAPVLAYDGETLQARFLDWQERAVQLTFLEVVAFSWDDGDTAACQGHRDDTSYIVSGSEWLRRHIDVGTINATGSHRHYKLCFNVVGVLQVIAAELRVSR